MTSCRRWITCRREATTPSLSSRMLSTASSRTAGVGDRFLGPALGEGQGRGGRVGPGPAHYSVPVPAITICQPLHDLPKVPANFNGKGLSACNRQNSITPECCSCRPCTAPPRPCAAPPPPRPATCSHRPPPPAGSAPPSTTTNRCICWYGMAPKSVRQPYWETTSNVAFSLKFRISPFRRV